MNNNKLHGLSQNNSQSLYPNQENINWYYLNHIHKPINKSKDTYINYKGNYYFTGEGKG